MLNSRRCSTRQPTNLLHYMHGSYAFETCRSSSFCALIKDKKPVCPTYGHITVAHCCTEPWCRLVVVV